MIFDYIIVGQGLAGTTLAWQLLKRGKELAIIDPGGPAASSKVGAGLMNPFTGPKMVKTWKADELFAYAEAFYRELEEAAGRHFFEERIIYRPFRSAEGLNDWHGKSSQENYRKFIKGIRGKNYYTDYVHDPFGGVELNGFLLDMPLFIRTMNGYFHSQCAFLKESFDEESLEFHETDMVRYKNMEARKIIFCTGYQIVRSRYFSWLPVSPLKGELLKLKMKANFKTIFNRSGFIIPRGEGIFVAGSTYGRDDLSNNTTEGGKNEICQKLDALIKLNYEIMGQTAGIRPVTTTRRPIAGLHPEHSTLCVFNGLGTKGVSLAPYFSEQLADYLENGNNPDGEIDIKKYYSLYYESQYFR